MFGLSTKERLFTFIINTAQNFAPEYKENVKELLLDLESGMSEDEFQLKAVDTRRLYLDSVLSSVSSTMKSASSKIFHRFSLVLSSPGICGYSDINIDNGILAGSLYAMLYYSFTNKIANPKDCVYLNHLHNDIMDLVLQELDNEMSSPNHNAKVDSEEFL